MNKTMKKYVIIAICCLLIGILGYSINRATQQSPEDREAAKLERIEELEIKEKELTEETDSLKTDAKYRENKEALTEVLTEKNDLEMETDTFDYKGALEIAINSSEAAHETGDNLLKENPEKFSDKRKKGISESKKLDKKYRDILKNSDNYTNEDYKKLLEDYYKEKEELNQKGYFKK